MTKTNDSKLTTLDEILKEGAKNVSTDKLYWGITNEAHRLEIEIENLSRKTEAKAKILADSLMDKNISFKEALRELNELYNRTVEVENKEIKINIIEILDVASAIVRDSMEQAECGIIKFNTKNKEIKNNNDDTAVKANEYGITVNGVLKINQEQEQEMGVINYLPVTFTGANFAPEFIEQVTKEVIKKMKEDHISFGKIQLPAGIIPVNDVNKVTSKAGSSVIMDKEGVVTAKVGDTSATTTKEEMICKVDNQTSNTEDIEVNKEKDSEASSITVNIKIPEIVQEIINSYVESLETMSKVLKEAEEEANCEIEALKGEVNSLKAENDKLKEQIKNDEEIDTKFFKEVSRYFKECKGEQLEKIYDREQVVLAKMRKILKETNAERATVLLNVLTKIIPALSIIK